MHTIAFPKMADYDVPARYLLNHITNCKIIKPEINLNTIEIGSKHSPDFVCTPFKYTLGTLIKGLEKGADTLIQFGGGCRYGYYAALQEEILKKSGYKFKMYNLITAGKTDIKRIKKVFKTIDPNIKIYKSLRYLIIAFSMAKYMDRIDDYIRENIGFEVDKGSFIRLKKEMLKDFYNCNGLFHLKRLYRKYKKSFRKIKVDKPKDCLKVGIIGELYTLMEDNSNYNIEYELAKYKISIKRFTNVTYLLLKKRKLVKKYLRKMKNIKYKLGADALDNIYHTKYLCKKKYDGIVHIKSSFCTPEIGAMPLINDIAKKNNVPVIFFSFDTNTSKVGVETRIEAFVDMLKMKKGRL